MLDKRIQSLKEKLKEQIEFAKDQYNLGGFSNAVYGFVEIIENDPVISRFVKIKIDQEYEVQRKTTKLEK
jgi:hypothetical protein